MTDTDQREASQSVPEPDFSEVCSCGHTWGGQHDTRSVNGHCDHCRCAAFSSEAHPYKRTERGPDPLVSAVKQMVQGLKTDNAAQAAEIARLTEDRDLADADVETLQGIVAKRDQEIARLNGEIARLRGVLVRVDRLCTEQLAEQAERHRAVVEAANTVAAYLYSVVNPGTIPTSVRVAMDRITPASLDQASPAQPSGEGFGCLIR